MGGIRFDEDMSSMGLADKIYAKLGLKVSRHKASTPEVAGTTMDVPARPRTPRAGPESLNGHEEQTITCKDFPKT